MAENDGNALLGLHWTIGEAEIRMAHATSHDLEESKAR